MTEPAATDLHRDLAIEANNRALELLDKRVRSEAEEEEAMQAAYAAAYHWARTPSADRLTELRATYLIGKAQLARKDTSASLRYAAAARHLADGLKADGLDLALVYSLSARAYYLAGERDKAKNAIVSARAVTIPVDADRDRLEEELADL